MRAPAPGTTSPSPRPGINARAMRKQPGEPDCWSPLQGALSTSPGIYAQAGARRLETRNDRQDWLITGSTTPPWVNHAARVTARDLRPAPRVDHTALIRTWGLGSAPGIDRAACLHQPGKEPSHGFREIPNAPGDPLGLTGRGLQGRSPRGSEERRNQDYDGSSANDTHDRLLSGRRLSRGLHDRGAAPPAVWCPVQVRKPRGRALSRRASGG
jgi:hypothetical protein